MKSMQTSSAPASGQAPATRSDWQTIAQVLPYLWRYRYRVGLALLCMIGAKAATVAVPILLKYVVDGLVPEVNAQTAVTAALTVPVALVVAYGLLRMCTTLFTELREMVFARVTTQAVREAALEVFEHLHRLSLRFHLERQTGGLTSDIERGTRGIASLVSYTLYSILPTIVEIGLVIGYLAANYELSFALITLSALVLYAVFTVVVTQWRTHILREMNDLDRTANSGAIDTLINYETVKYFGNEAFESERYDSNLAKHQRARLRSQLSLSALNVGQAIIVSTAVALMIWRATVGVVEGRMSLGDLVLINGFMIQLYIPLNFLGSLYRMIRQSLTDMERMFGLLDAKQETVDAPDAVTLDFKRDANHQLAPPSIRFDTVNFAYQPDRPILTNVDFEIAAGTTCAVVGSSGAGKSTLSRLLYRFYDVNQGSIKVGDRDVRELTQHSLRASIGIVPQDTVLFNDTIGYNVAYGRPGASQEQIEQAIQGAQLDQFIARLPDGLQTRVGERGLKLSGGEKQRVAIARMLLKDPPILILDEATSALDSANEKAIQTALDAAAQRRTTLIIAHRLSTIVDADQILVMNEGRVVERGTHLQLLARRGVYADMWALQQSEQTATTDPTA